MKISPQPKLFLRLSGVVAVLGVGLMYMTYSSNSETIAKIEQLQKEVRDEKEVQTELTNNKRNVMELKAKLEHLESGVQQAAYIPTMLKELEDYGKKNKMTILSVKPVMAANAGKKGDKKKSSYEELNVAVKARGEYADTVRFLNALTNFPKIIAIRTVSIAPKADASMQLKKKGKPQLDVDLEVRAYVFKEEPVKSDSSTTEADENKTAAVAQQSGGNS
jgi:Tfp pilus assembly protein PilO